MQIQGRLHPTPRASSTRAVVAEEFRSSAEVNARDPSASATAADIPVHMHSIQVMGIDFSLADVNIWAVSMSLMWTAFGDLGKLFLLGLAAPAGVAVDADFWLSSFSP
eukprot:7444046-Pyramimonas_sp.AAC.1